MPSATRPSRRPAVLRWWLLAGVAVLGAAAPAGRAAAAPHRICTSPATPVTVAYERLPGVPADATSLDVYVPAGCRARTRRAPVVMWGPRRRLPAGRQGQRHRGQAAAVQHAGLGVRERRLPPHASRRPGLGALPRPLPRRRGGRGLDAPGHQRLRRRPEPDRGARPLGRGGHRSTSSPTRPGSASAASGSPRCAAPGRSTPRASTRRGSRPPRPSSASGARRWQRPELRGRHVRDAARPGGDRHPATLTVVRGTLLRRSIQADYAARLRSLGVPAATIDASSLTHAEVSNRIGAPGDTVMTPPLLRFLRGCFAR